MIDRKRAALSLALFVSLCAATTASAQTPAPKSAQAAPAAKPATNAGKSSQAIQTPQQRRKAAGVPEPTTAEQIVALPPADEQQKAAADLVHYGKYVCDEKFEVFIERNTVADHYVDVRYKKDVWVMKPVASATGAVRLEDTRGKVLLVQIPFKSMLLNTQTGQRIVDSCQHDIQRGAENDQKTNPVPASQFLKP